MSEQLLLKLLKTDNSNLTQVCMGSVEIMNMCVNEEFLKRKVSKNKHNLEIKKLASSVPDRAFYPVFLTYTIYVRNHIYTPYRSYEPKRANNIKEQFVDSIHQLIHEYVDDRSQLPDQKRSILLNNYIIWYDGVDTLDIVLFGRATNDPADQLYITEDFDGFIRYQIQELDTAIDHDVYLTLG
jgi:hypothetical protein